MASERKEARLSTLCAYLNRGAAPAYTDRGGILVLNQKCIRDQRVSFDEARRTDTQKKPVAQDRMLQPFDILVNSTGVGTLGRVAQVRELPEPATVDSHVTVVRPDPRAVDPLYLGMTLRSFESDVEALGEGSTGQTELSRSRLSAFAVPVPSRTEQRAIAHILGTLDDKIELNRRMSETLEAMARALFSSWFVDFDPVRAKAEGRDPGLPKALADLFPARCVESELGEIPVGWEATSVGEVCSRVAMGPFGSDIKTENFVESGVPVIRGANLKHGFVDGEFVYLTEAKATELRNANALPGDIVVTHRGTLGQVGLIPQRSRFPRYVVSQSQMLLTVAPERCLPRYVYMYLRSSAGQHALLSNTSQTGVPAIARPTASVKAIPLLVPPKPVLEAFGNIVEPLHERLDQSVREARTLAAMRDGLLPKLISGEMRVNDPERFVAVSV